MENLKSNESIFSIRIVSIDYYMSPPIPDMDICYSSFQGGKVNEVPVIRIFGSTPAGQKSCLHVHRVLPYLYVPCSDISLQTSEEGDAYTRMLSRAIENALKVDNNLYGMGHLHVSKVKFRHPLPDNVFARAVHHKGQLSTSTEKLTRVSADSQADSSVDASLASPIWISSTISKGWIWHIPTEHDASQDLDFYLVKRLSTCDLEGDAIVDEILNQQLKMYSSLSQTRPEVKMVQSLVPIWEEEYERTRKREESLSSDLSSKPSPYFVLKTLLHGNEIEYARLVLCGDAIISSFQNTPLSEAEKFVQSVRSLTDVGNMIEFGEHVNTKHPSEELLESSLEQNEKETVLSDGSLAKQNVDSRALECEHELSQLKPDDKEMLKSGKTEASTSKVTGFVALGLSKWFDSSQVAAVLNTDAETDHNFDISDLLHTPSSDWVSEKANLNYDCQSQQECQDILDSVDNLIACENVTPQVDDGSHGDKHKGHVGASSQVDKGLALTSERKGRKRLRESLPLSSHDNADDVIESASLESKALPRKKVNTLFVDSAANADSSNYGSSEGRKVSLSSMRDLMRRKRHHRVEPSDFQPKRLEFNTSQNDMETVIPTGISLKLRGKDKHTAAYEGISCTESCSSDLFSNVGEVEPERSPVKYVEMTFIKKSPVLECLDEKSNDTSSASAVRGQTFSVNEDKSEGTCNFNSLDVNGRDGDAIPPFFGKEDEVYHNLYDNEDHYIVKDIALGVPIHYQSAGPSFYLLTPVLSPPSVDSVHKWLSPFARKTITGITDTSRESIDSVFLKPPSSKENKCLGPLNKDNGSLNIVKKSSDSVHRIDLFPDASSQENKEILKKETYLWDSKISSKSDSKGSKLKGKERIKKWQDISQFPFPEEKSKLTPLSQKGFRDPASVGNGQQLTLLSMEIQAESRGDLRPNPRIDAINVIALVIQEDNDHVHESYLLLHGSNGELYPSKVMWETRRPSPWKTEVPACVSSAARAKLDFKLVRVSWYQSDLVESDLVAMAEGPNATDPAQVLAQQVGGPSVNPRPLNTRTRLDQLEDKMHALSGIIDQVTTLEERLDGFSDDQAHVGERLVTLEGVVEGIWLLFWIRWLNFPRK
ncbi:hypothetical protein GIB67_006816 [Kingdonia uniflora]|uniref:DNA polymerase zeta catalytic subunit N-terminal domain-containing protein n=1 Tax=Kingdonia uniflora TaxID=39325 RepID=A0A7J7L065_9MAGN|nr:hypothetical protein GIB67_006816 [Kingdonia uniflora]